MKIYLTGVKILQKVFGGTFFDSHCISESICLGQSFPFCMLLSIDNSISLIST